MPSSQNFRFLACMSLIGFVAFQAPLALHAQSNATNEAPPTWLAWKVFHDSLTFYDQKAQTDLQKMLTAKLRLSSVQINHLMNAGNSYRAALKKIDDDARAEVDRRYGPRAIAQGKLRNQPKKSMRQRVIDDGLYAEVEAKKQDAFATHRDNVLKGLNAVELARIGNFIQKSVTPHIRTFDIDLPASGNAGPPPVKRVPPPADRIPERGR